MAAGFDAMSGDAYGKQKLSEFWSEGGIFFVLLLGPDEEVLEVLLVLESPEENRDRRHIGKKIATHINITNFVRRQTQQNTPLGLDGVRALCNVRACRWCST